MIVQTAAMSPCFFFFCFGFFFLFFLSSVFIASACFCFCSLCLVATQLPLCFLHTQFIQLVSITAIQSKIKINIEIKVQLYYGLTANSDQSFHYYKILSRVVGQRRFQNSISISKVIFFVKTLVFLNFFVWNQIAHNIVYLKHLYFFPMGNYLPLRLIKTIVRIFA